LKSHFLHNSFNNGLNAWLEKHNRHSWHEAEEAKTALREHQLDITGLISDQSVRRRRALKELSFRLPCRLLLRFLYTFIWRRGFLVHRPGLMYCRLMAKYEYMIVLKMKKIERWDKGLPI
jgi:hypothetical protein